MSIIRYYLAMANLNNRLRSRRQAAGLTQQALATQAGISRQAYIAVERGATNPSTEVALKLAHALNARVEELFFLAELTEPVSADLAAGGDLEAASLINNIPGQSRVRLAQVGPRMMAWPVREAARVTFTRSDGVVLRSPAPGRALIQPFDPEEMAAPSLALLGCDPAVALLEPALRQRGVRLVWSEETSRRALLGLANDEAHIAGCHLKDAATGQFNHSWVQELVPFPCTLVTFAAWQQGFIVACNNPKGIYTGTDLARPDVMLINRQLGSGSRAVLERLLGANGIPQEQVQGYASEAGGHLAVAQIVAMKLADVGIGVASAARAWGLGFVPVEDERYDLVIPDHFLDEPVVQVLLDLLGRPALARQVESLGGYDVEWMGQLAPSFKTSLS
jgi:molybdate-binding protein/DNA-binding XRE family transcriptional regulator